MDLSATETRVLGCLLEKQRTTPDAYQPRAAAPAPGWPSTSDGSPAADRSRELDELRERVARLERDVALLRERIREPAPQVQS
jgi:uncharacterized protein YceH (UPF0502 family)